MGKIIYGSMRQEIDIDDRAMAHLQAVVATKLRRGEGFFINWKDDPSVGDGEMSRYPTAFSVAITGRPGSVPSR